MDQFLGLTASDLANKDLQLKRQQGVDSLKQASHRVSTEEELENMVRLAMSGQETWRDGVRSTTKDAADNANATAKQISVDTNVATGDSEEMDLDSPKFHAASESMDEEEEPANTRFLEIESKVLNQKNQNNMNRNPKRPLEADASTRITRDDPKLKFAKLDPVRIAETKPSSAEKAPKGETTKVSTPTEAKAKAPNLLEMLKSKQIGTPVVEVSVSAPSPSKASAASPSSSSAASTPVTKTKPLGSPFTPCMRMINKDGKEDFTITRPGGILLHAAGLISEK